MNYERVKLCLFRAVAAGVEEAALRQAMPDKRLTSPIVDCGFGWRVLDPIHAGFDLPSGEVVR